jgi:hypothetical protein
MNNISLMDGQATPVARTFIPFAAQSGQNPAVFLEKTSDTATGYKRLELLVRRPQGSRATKTKLLISDPTLAFPVASSGQYTGAPKVAFSTMADLVITIPDDAGLAQRKDILSYVKQACLSNEFMNAVLYGTPVL